MKAVRELGSVRGDTHGCSLWQLKGRNAKAFQSKRTLKPTPLVHQLHSQKCIAQAAKCVNIMLAYAKLLVNLRPGG